MKILLLTSYDGTEFSGWQRQRERRTVQGELERAASALFGGIVTVKASGRTDAGVHALGQVVQLDVQTALPPDKAGICLNRLLPPDVRILKSAEAPCGFDCTRGVRQKTYRYTAYACPAEIPLLTRYAARLRAVPDLGRMREAAELLLGEHDFCAFRASGYTSKTSVRTLYGVNLEESPLPGGKLCSVTVTGNGFLYNMVRILAGELFAVGCGKREGITEAFASGKRSALAKTMPPQGLTLMKVDYGAPLFGAEE